MTKLIREALKEGIIGVEAINIINGDRHKFYIKLLSYVTKKNGMSKELFDKIWTNTYTAIDEYGKGDIVKAAEYIERELHRLEVEKARLEKTDWTDFVPDEFKDEIKEINSRQSIK